jgi:hypothetical protein
MFDDKALCRVLAESNGCAVVMIDVQMWGLNTDSHCATKAKHAFDWCTETWSWSFGARDFRTLISTYNMSRVINIFHNVWQRKKKPIHQ